MRAPRESGGFTLLEVLVVTLILGILASIAIFQYSKVTERSRAAEALAFLADLDASQSRYLQRSGIYFTGSLTAASFDNVLPTALQYFAIGTVAGSANSWTATLTRTAAVNTYGQYSITATHDPAGLRYTCTGNSCAELLP